MSECAEATIQSRATDTKISKRWWLGFVLAVTLVLWASAFIAIPIALESFSPRHLAVTRQALSAAITLPVIVHLWHRELWPAIRSKGIWILAMGLSGITFYHLALGAGQRTVDAGTASLLINLGPIVSAVLAAGLLKERLTKRLVTGGIVAFLGATGLVLMRNSAMAIDRDALFVILATVLQSTFFIIQRRLSAHFSAVALAVLAIWVGAITLFPLGEGALGAFRQASTQSMAAVLFLGGIIGVVPYFGWAYVIANIPVSRAAIALYLIPPLSILLGWLILDQVPSPALLVCGAIILSGLAMARGAGK